MKLSVTHSKKIPGAEAYSSEGFSCSLEVEVPQEHAQDAAVVQQWLSELYGQARASIEDQIKSVPRRIGNGGQSPAGIFGRPNNDPQGDDRPAQGDGIATPKQISFLVSLGARNKLTFADLQKIAQERFAAEDLYRLSKQQASELIDGLKPEAARR